MTSVCSCTVHILVMPESPTQEFLANLKGLQRDPAFLWNIARDFHRNLGGKFNRSEAPWVDLTVAVSMGPYWGSVRCCGFSGYAYGVYVVEEAVFLTIRKNICSFGVQWEKLAMIGLRAFVL